MPCLPFLLRFASYTLPPISPSPLCPCSAPSFERVSERFRIGPRLFADGRLLTALTSPARERSLLRRANGSTSHGEPTRTERAVLVRQTGQGTSFSRAHCGRGRQTDSDGIERRTSNVESTDVPSAPSRARSVPSPPPRHRAALARSPSWRSAPARPPARPRRRSGAPYVRRAIFQLPDRATCDATLRPARDGDGDSPLLMHGTAASKREDRSVARRQLQGALACGR